MLADTLRDALVALLEKRHKRIAEIIGEANGEAHNQQRNRSLTPLEHGRQIHRLKRGAQQTPAAQPQNKWLAGWPLGILEKKKDGLSHHDTQVFADSETMMLFRSKYAICVRSVCAC